MDGHVGVSTHEFSLAVLLRVLRRRKWVFLVCVLVVPVLAYVLTARQPAEYRASAQVYLSTQDLGGALTGITPQYIDEQRLADTAANLAQTPEVARHAVERSGIRGITPDQLLGQVSVTPQGGTNILVISVTGHNRRQAALLATAYARAFATYRGQLDTSALRVVRQGLATKISQLSAAGQGSSRLAIDLHNKDQQLATLEVLQTTRTYVIRTADSAAQIAPRPKNNAGIGLMVGIVLGIGLVFGIEALDTRVRSPREVGDRLNLPQLARVPPPPKTLQKKDRLVMITDPTGTSAEAFRMLRTNLEFATLDSQNARTILVTSAIEQEGKSTTSANLAIAEARAGRRVVLVDLDLRAPYVATFFELLPAPGITDVALGNIELQAALRRVDLKTGKAHAPRRVMPETNGHNTEKGSLDVLIAGSLPPDPGEFVGSRRLGDILAQLNVSYDRVIIDTPPLLRVGDPMTLTTWADAILLVTKLNVIRRPMLSEMRRLLGTAPALKLGYVVTGRGDRESRGYGYGYGYTYGYGYKKGGTAKLPDAAPEPTPAETRSSEQPLPAEEQRPAETSAESALARISEMVEKTERQ